MTLMPGHPLPIVAAAGLPSRCVQQSGQVRHKGDPAGDSRPGSVARSHQERADELQACHSRTSRTEIRARISGVMSASVSTAYAFAHSSAASRAREYARAQRPASAAARLGQQAARILRHIGGVAHQDPPVSPHDRLRIHTPSLASTAALA